MKLSVTLAFFGYMMASSLAQASDINMWREPKQPDSTLIMMI